MIKNLLKNKHINYQIINILISLIECTQNTILVWLVYKYTYSSFGISLINFANYFPMVISIFTLISIADNINPLYQNYINNLLSFLISFLIFLLFLFKPKLNIFLLLIFILQISFSFIRTLNKTNFNKITKILFKKKDINKILKISLSIIQVSQTIGNLIGNLFVLNNIPLFGFIFTCLIYIINSFISYILWKKYKNIFILEKTNKKFKLNLFKSLFNNKKLLSILLFSIPSSGLFQYLMAILPFLTNIIKLKSHYSYSILNFFCTFFSSIVGFVLYKNFIFNLIKNYTFLICSILLYILVISKNFFFILIINSICLGILSGHIICMQIEINKYSSYINLGKYTILRNSISSFSKILFSLLSIYFVNNFSLSFVYFFGSIVLFIFQFLYYLFNYFL